jgi:hypothetical protein
MFTICSNSAEGRPNMHAAPRLRTLSAPQSRPDPLPQPTPRHTHHAEAALPPRPAAALPLRPATPLRPVRTLPGTVPFDDAAQAWFWTVAALAARHGNGLGRRTPGSQAGPRIPRPCDPDDIIRALDLLYRRGGIGPAHARILRHWGERFTVPTAGGTKSADAVLWAEAMDQLDGVLRPKGILA